MTVYVDPVTAAVNELSDDELMETWEALERLNPPDPDELPEGEKAASYVWSASEVARHMYAAALRGYRDPVYNAMLMRGVKAPERQATLR